VLVGEATRIGVFLGVDVDKGVWVGIDVLVKKGLWVGVGQARLRKLKTWQGVFIGVEV